MRVQVLCLGLTVLNMQAYFHLGERDELESWTWWYQAGCKDALCAEQSDNTGSGSKYSQFCVCFFICVHVFMYLQPWWTLNKLSCRRDLCYCEDLSFLRNFPQFTPLCVFLVQQGFECCDIALTPSQKRSIRAQSMWRTGRPIWLHMTKD